MDDLIKRLKDEAEKVKFTDLAAVLQWAALHIKSQSEALEEVREELELEQNTRIRLERVLHESQKSIEAALAAVKGQICPGIDFSRDLSGHINLMSAHGDQDYTKSNGQSVRHVDTRSTKPRKTKKD